MFVLIFEPEAHLSNGILLALFSLLLFTGMTLLQRASSTRVAKLHEHQPVKVSENKSEKTHICLYPHVTP